MPNRYTKLSILLHWFMAILLIATLGIGLTLEDMPFSPQKIQTINWHKWAGITVLWLTAIRLAWRISHPTPATLDSLLSWEKKLSTAAHHLLYLLMFAIPLSGWLMSSAKGFPVVYFQILPLPDLIGKQSHDVAETLEELHGLLANGFVVLLALHVAGALKHQWLDKKPILFRMGIGKPPKDLP